MKQGSNKVLVSLLMSACMVAMAVNAFAFATPTAASSGFAVYTYASDFQAGGWGYVVGMVGGVIACWRGYEGAYKQAIGTAFCTGGIALLPQIMSGLGMLI